MLRNLVVRILHTTTYNSCTTDGESERETNKKRYRGERERERERERETDRMREREENKRIEIKGDKEGERQTGRDTEGEREREVLTWIYCTQTQYASNLLSPLPSSNYPSERAGENIE